MEKKNGTFTPQPSEFAMPKWLVKCGLSTGAKMVYMILTTCAGRKDFAFPSQEYLSQAASVCVRTVQRHLRALADYGLIRIDKRQVHGTMRTVYCFLNHAVMGFEKKAFEATAEKPKLQAVETGGECADLPILPPVVAKLTDSSSVEDLSPDDDKNDLRTRDNSFLLLQKERCFSEG